MTTPTETAALQFDSVGKRYRRHIALHDLSFRIEPGQCAVIAGVNGAGKTTLLRCLLDFTRPDSGAIRIGRIDSREPRAREHLAFLPERFLPPQHLSGHEVLVWLAGLHGCRWSRAQTLAVMAEYGLPQAAENRPLRHFSKGMTQKLGLAAALHGGRPILVLDEPLSGLDVLARRFVLAALRQAREQGRTILLTSHSLAELAPLCDRLIVIDQGELRFCGPQRQLCEQHQVDDLEDAFVRCVDRLPAFEGELQ